MTGLYLLWASQGEYSDRSEWAIAAYERKEDAEAAVLRGSALWRVLMAEDGYVPYDERAKRLATPEGQELTALLGSEPSFYDELTLTCCEIEVRAAQGIEAATAAETVELGSVHESPVPTGCAQPSQPLSPTKDNSNGC